MEERDQEFLGLSTLMYHGENCNDSDEKECDNDLHNGDNGKRK